MNSVPHQSPHYRTGILYGLVAALIWGTWPILSQLGVNESLSAFDIAALRFGVSGFILLPFVWRHATKGLGWGRAFWLSCGAGAPYILVMISGMSYAPASHAGIIMPGSMLVFSALGGHLFLNEYLTRTRLVGLTIVIIGITLTGWNGLTGATGAMWKGDLLFLCGGLFWASYTVSSRLWGVSPLHATALVSVISMILFLPFYGVTVGFDIFLNPSTEIIFQGLFQGVVTAIFGLIFFTRAIAILGAGRGSMFAALAPGITVLITYPVLGEVPGVLEILGVIVVSFGMGAALGLYRTRQYQSA